MRHIAPPLPEASSQPFSASISCSAKMLAPHAERESRDSPDVINIDLSAFDHAPDEVLAPTPPTSSRVRFRSSERIQELPPAPPSRSVIKCSTRVADRLTAFTGAKAYRIPSVLIAGSPTTFAGSHAAAPHQRFPAHAARQASAAPRPQADRSDRSSDGARTPVPARTRPSAPGARGLAQADNGLTFRPSEAARAHFAGRASAAAPTPRPAGCSPREHARKARPRAPRGSPRSSS